MCPGPWWPNSISFTSQGSAEEFVLLWVPLVALGCPSPVHGTGTGTWAGDAGVGLGFCSRIAGRGSQAGGSQARVCRQGFAGRGLQAGFHRQGTRCWRMSPTADPALWLCCCTMSYLNMNFQLWESPGVCFPVVLEKPLPPPLSVQARGPK